MLPRHPPAAAACTPAARRRLRRARLRDASSPDDGRCEVRLEPCAAAARAERDDESWRATKASQKNAEKTRAYATCVSPPSTSKAGTAAAAAALAAARAATAPELPNTWEFLPDGVLATVFASLPRPALHAARLVCQRWRAVADGSVTALAPSAPRLYTISSRFPALRCLNLGATARNRAAVLLSRPDALRGLRALALGGGGGGSGGASGSSGGGGRLTNAAVTALAAGSARTRLTALKLAGCDALTNTGLAALPALARLRVLCVVGCDRVTDGGLAAAAVAGLPALAALESTAGGDATLAALGKAGPPLASLRLGGKGAGRVTDGGLAALAVGRVASTLRSVCLSCAPVSAAALTPFTRLTCLALRGCPDIDDDGVAALAAHLRCLSALDLRHCRRVGDAAVAALAASPHTASNLTALRLEGTAASPSAALSLAGLPSLRDLGLDAYNPAAGGGGVLTAAGLRGVGWAGRLTRLALRGLAVPAPLLAALPAAFPALADLTVVDWGGALAFAPGTGRPLPPPRTPPPRVCLVAPLAGLPALTTLDLASPRLGDADALALAAALPGLEVLVLAAPRVSAGCIATLKTGRPGLDVGRARRRAPDEWAVVGGSVWA